MIALYCDYEGDYTQPYSCVIGCAVNSLGQIPEGMVGKMVPAATFALFHTVGEFLKSLIDTWGNIWRSNLQRVGDYEVYRHKFSAPFKETHNFLRLCEKDLKDKFLVFSAKDDPNGTFDPHEFSKVLSTIAEQFDIWIQARRELQRRLSSNSRCRKSGTSRRSHPAGS